MDEQPDESDKVLLDTGVVTCLTAEKGEAEPYKKPFENLLAGMQYVVCPVTEAESWHRARRNHLGPRRTGKLLEFLEGAEYLQITSSTAKIYSDIPWPERGNDKPGQNDQWLVALAIEHKIPLATWDGGVARQAAGIVPILYLPKKADS